MPEIHPVPTIAELLTSYRVRTGDSYEEMSRKVGNEITRARMHQLTTAPPREFPKNARTIELLAGLLQVPIPTILDGFAKALGLPVTRSESLLSITLPPGADTLDPGDVDAIRAVVRQLVDARRRAVGPDMSKVQGLRLAEDADEPAPAPNHLRHDG